MSSYHLKSQDRLLSQFAHQTITMEAAAASQLALTSQNPSLTNNMLLFHLLVLLLYSLILNVCSMVLLLYFAIVSTTLDASVFLYFPPSKLKLSLSCCQISSLSLSFCQISSLSELLSFLLLLTTGNRQGLLNFRSFHTSYYDFFCTLTLKPEPEHVPKIFSRVLCDSTPRSVALRATDCARWLLGYLGENFHLCYMAQTK